MTTAVLPKTIPELVQRSADLWPDATAIIDLDRRLTFAELHRETVELATRLSAVGVRRGGRVAIWMGNSVDWVLADLAVELLGATVVPVNIQFSPDEVRYVLEQSRSDTLVMDGHFRERDLRSELSAFSGQLADLRTTIVHDVASPVTSTDGQVSWSELLASDLDGELERSASPDDVAYILYTSGTTSFPKGVQLTHSNVLHTAVEFGRAFGWKPGDRNLAGPPLFSSYGAVSNVLGGLVHGVATLTMPRFSPSRALELIAQEGVTTFIGVDTMLRDMISLVTEGSHAAPTTLRSVTAIPMDPVLAEQVRSILHVENLFSGFGMTEAAACSVLIRLDNDCSNLNVLTPLPGVRLRVVDPQTLEESPVDKPGELVISGAGVMIGYFDKPAETTSAFLEDRTWLRSGDLAVKAADGTIHFQGRLKDVVRTGGFNVSALEVERVLKQHPTVIDAAYFGVPHERLNEIGVAYIRVSDPRTAPEDVLEFTRQHLARFKVPHAIHLADTFPLTSTGKVQKAKLREIHLSSQETESRQ